MTEEQQALQQMKALITHQMDVMITDEVFKNSSAAEKSTYIDNIYTVIMALGYNAGSIDDAAWDIFEIKEQMMDLDQNAFPSIKAGVADVLKQFKVLVDVFSLYHFNSSELMSYKDAVAVTAKHFNDLEFTVKEEELEEDLEEQDEKETNE